MNPILWAVVLPFMGAVGCLLARGRGVAWIGGATALAVAAVCAKLLVIVWRQGETRVALGGWAAPLGIGLQLDGLGAMFMMLTAVVGGLVGPYAASYFARSPDQHRMGASFWPLWMILWGGLNGFYLCADLFNAYVLLEVCGLAAVGLTVLSGSTAAVAAGLRYLLATMFGSLMYLLGVGLVYAATGQLDFWLAARQVTPTVTIVAAFGVMVFGLLIKSALLPFHFWLPPAHSNAPAPVSALLSALVVKASFFLLLRLWFVVFPVLTGQTPNRLPDAVPGIGQMLGLLGGLAMLWGSFQALRQTRLKMLIAYSTVGQLGYLFLLFALLDAPGAEAWATMAWAGTVFHVFSHALAKAALFLAAGCLLLAMGTDDLRAMRDIAGRLPVVTFTLGVAGISLMGLPPSAGFVAKWMLLRAALTSGHWWWALVIVVTGLLTAAYVFKILYHTFVPAEGEGLVLQPVPAAMTLTALGLAVICALSGFRAEEVIALLPRDLAVTGVAFGGGTP
jgi:formate hydrogenlyase subunit 3/multisubunit Na+/H+ antiporter MnhD subunit